MVAPFSDMNDYELLGISPNASRTQVRDAYAQRHRLGDPAIRAARDTLSSPEKRLAVDAFIPSFELVEDIQEPPVTAEAAQHDLKDVLRFIDETAVLKEDLRILTTRVVEEWLDARAPAEVAQPPRWEPRIQPLDTTALLVDEPGDHTASKTGPSLSRFGCTLLAAGIALIMFIPIWGPPRWRAFSDTISSGFATLMVSISEALELRHEGTEGGFARAPVPTTSSGRIDDRVPLQEEAAFVPQTADQIFTPTSTAGEETHQEIHTTTPTLTEQAVRKISLSPTSEPSFRAPDSAVSAPDSTRRQSPLIVIIPLTLTPVATSSLDILPSQTSSSTPTPTTASTSTPTDTPALNSTHTQPTSAVATASLSTTPSEVPSNTPLPTDTPTAKPSHTPIPTQTASDTQRIATVTTTPTKRPNLASQPTRTPTPQPHIITASARVHVRSCPELTCEIIGSLAPGVIVYVQREAEGATVYDSSKWYEIVLEDEKGFVHSALASPVTK